MVTAIVIFVFLAVTRTEAQAQNDQQQWCAYFTGGPTNCGFTTFAQCLEAIGAKPPFASKMLIPARRAVDDIDQQIADVVSRMVIAESSSHIAE